LPGFLCFVDSKRHVIKRISPNPVKILVQHLLVQEKRTLMKKFILLFILTFCSIAAEKPNIIVFLVDDCDKDETSVYGGNVLTPNLDRLAKEGMTFHNAHVTSTVCTPSRYTFLTGRYAGSSWAKHFMNEFPAGSQSSPGFNMTLENNNMNIGSLLKKNGYATGFVGKFHVGHEYGQNQKGFTFFEKNAEWTPNINKAMFENEKFYRQKMKEYGFGWAKNLYWNNLKTPFKGHNPEWTIDAALEFIQNNKDQPFYLHYCTTLMHGPNKEWFKSLSKQDITGEGIIKDHKAKSRTRDDLMQRVKAAGLGEEQAGYTWMDDGIGLILNKLKELKIDENTIFVFTADHGSTRKGSLFKHKGTEVPCIIRWPKGIPAASESHELIQNTDFVATWIETARIDKKDYKVDGLSFASLFKTPNKAIRDYVYSELGAARSVKTKDWNYIALRYTKEQVEGIHKNDRGILKSVCGLSGGFARGGELPGGKDMNQLYHLTQDPQELKNMAENPEYKEILANMKKMLSKELKRFNRPYGEFIMGGNAVAYEQQNNLERKIAKASASLKEEKMKDKRQSK